MNFNSATKILRRFRFKMNKKLKEEPSEYMIQALKEAEADKKISPTFDNAEDATAWLKDENRKYEDLQFSFINAANNA